MPHPGAHITVAQRLAASGPTFAAVMGAPNPNFDPDPNSPANLEVLKNRFANLGAVGPDLFYFLLDFNRPISDVQPALDMIVQFAGTVEAVKGIGKALDDTLHDVAKNVEDGVPCSGAIIHTVSGLTDQASTLASNLTGAFGTLLEGFAVDAGFNPWSLLELPRQSDRPRSEWFWADYLHYAKTGDFTKRLLEKSQEPAYRDHPVIFAYALGYLTHYITDTVGHPYVNQVVQAPYRLYWQRHALVENFIDAYLWDRWHTPDTGGTVDPVTGDTVDPVTREKRLDQVLTGNPSTPLGAGAPFTFARLHDLINCGNPHADDPVDVFVSSQAAAISGGIGQVAGLGLIGTASGADFDRWTRFMSEAIQEVYSPNTAHPSNLPTNNGYPSPADIGAAYSVARFFLKLISESDVPEPKFPDIKGDLTKCLKKLWDDLKNDLGSLPSPPGIDFGGSKSFSFSSFWNHVKAWVHWIQKAVEAIGKAVKDLLNNVCDTAGTFALDAVKISLYFLQHGVWALYQSFREMLVLAAYASPTADRVGQFPFLWQSPGPLQPGAYPVEERVVLIAVPGKISMDIPQADLWSNYTPLTVPLDEPKAFAELPSVGWTAPYLKGDLPDAFMDNPFDPMKNKDMFGAAGTMQDPVSEVVTISIDNKSLQVPVDTFGDVHLDYGGAMANCQRAIQAIVDAGNKLPPNIHLPNYNLDGDRGYGWPCWDVPRDGSGNSKVVLRPDHGSPAVSASIPRQAIVTAIPWKD